MPFLAIQSLLSRVQLLYITQELVKWFMNWISQICLIYLFPFISAFALQRWSMCKIWMAFLTWCTFFLPRLNHTQFPSFVPVNLLKNNFSFIEKMLILGGRRQAPVSNIPALNQVHVAIWRRNQHWKQVHSHRAKCVSSIMLPVI